jgi:hypothetical protein
MAGLRPGHPRLSRLKSSKNVDARDKPGHDELSHTGRSPFTVTRVPARVCGQ